MTGSDAFDDEFVAGAADDLGVGAGEDAADGFDEFRRTH